MKIEKNLYQNYKLLKLKLIKSKIYKKKYYLKNIKLEDIEYRLKKALYIIYLYHINNKKILFIGNPLNLFNEIKKLLKNTKHIFMPKDVWISGTITNQNAYHNALKHEVSVNNKLSKNIIPQLKQHLKEKSDLVVIIDKESNINKALEESYTSRLPTIALNSDLNPFDIKSNYKVPGNFILTKNKLKNNFFYSILFSTLKKSNKIKKLFPTTSSSYKLKTVSIFKKPKKKYYKKRKNEFH